VFNVDIINIPRVEEGLKKEKLKPAKLPLTNSETEKVNKCD